MTNKYSVQFERFNDDPEKLLCNAIQLSASVCDAFPLHTSSGYLAYKELPEMKGNPKQEFWFSVVEATSCGEAYKKAVAELVCADLDKPFPHSLCLIEDGTLRIL